MITVNGYRCAICKDVVYSRASRDCRSCSCGKTSVDGGQGSFFKISFNPDAHPTSVVIYLHEVEDLAELYNDWNHGKDRYGLIKRGTVDVAHQIIERAK